MTLIPLIPYLQVSPLTNVLSPWVYLPKGSFTACCKSDNPYYMNSRIKKKPFWYFALRSCSRVQLVYRHKINIFYNIFRSHPIDIFGFLIYFIYQPSSPCATSGARLVKYFCLGQGSNLWWDIKPVIRYTPFSLTLLQPSTIVPIADVRTLRTLGQPLTTTLLPEATPSIWKYK